MTAGKNSSRGALKASVLSCILILPLIFAGNAGTAGDNLLDRLALPRVESFALGNGMKVFYIQDELPKLNIIVTAGFGKLYEMKGNAGISELAARTVSISGSMKYPGSRLNEEIESLGGEFSVSASWESIDISIKVLSRHSRKAFDIIADVLKNPNFDEKYVNIAKGLMIEEIKRKKDSPDTLAFEKVREIIFDGDGYGSVPTEEGIRSMKGEALKDLWKKCFSGSNVLAGVSSQEDYRTVRNAVEMNLGSLDRGERLSYHVDQKRLTANVREKSSRIYLVPKNIPQSTIVVGTLAPDISYGGKYSLKVMNYILGGGSFNSRLVTEIRVKKGLAYAVQSVLRFKHRTGVFIGFAQTKTSSTEEVLAIMLENIDLITKKAVDGEELQWAKKSIYNSYIFLFDTLRNLISNYINASYYGLPDDYYRNYPGFIDSVTREEVLAESARIFQTGLIKVVVGSRDLAERLKKFGEVVVVE